MSKPRPSKKQRSRATGAPQTRRRLDGTPRTRRNVFISDDLYERTRSICANPQTVKKGTDIYGTIGEAIETALKMLLKHHRVP